eukprot:359163-Pelagomonas_calceolata.AAC.1
MLGLLHRKNKPDPRRKHGFSSATSDRRGDRLLRNPKQPQVRTLRSKLLLWSVAMNGRSREIKLAKGGCRPWQATKPWSPSQGTQTDRSGYRPQCFCSAALVGGCSENLKVSVRVALDFEDTYNTYFSTNCRDQ